MTVTSYPHSRRILPSSIASFGSASLLAWLALVACDPVDEPARGDAAADEENATYLAFGLGDTAPEIADAYAYLRRFGYFPSAQLARTYPGWQPLVAEDPDDPEVFDDLLEEALLLFQAAHGLAETGLLDPPTRALMARPRCGFPDYHHADGGMVPRYGLLGTQWPTRALKYAFTGYTADTSQAAQRAAVTQAMGSWAAVAGLSFAEQANPDILVGFVAKAHGDGNDFQDNTYAHAYRPGGGLGGDIHFNDQTWHWGGGGDTQDVQSVALHELGHALGLDHSALSSAVMYAYLTQGAVKRMLTQDDIDGIRALYPYTAWASLGGTLSSLALGQNLDGRLEVFARAGDGTLLHNWQTTPNGGWSGWASLGGGVLDTPAVGRNKDGRLEVFVQGTDGALWHNWQTAPNGGWSGWASLGGWLANPAVANNADGRVEVFGVGSDSAVHHVWQTSPGGGWSGWASLGGVVKGAIAAGRNKDGRLEVFARGSNDALYHDWQTAPGGGWSGWASLGGVLTGAPVAGQNVDGRLEVFVQGTGDQPYHNWQTTPNGGWSGWAAFDGAVKALAVTRNQDGRLELFARGTDNAIHHMWQTTPNGGWSGWASFGQQFKAGVAAAINQDGRLEVFGIATNGAGLHAWQTSAGGAWN